MRLLVLAAALIAASVAPVIALDAPTPAAVQAFLDAHAHAPGVMVRPSGLQMRVVRKGNGRPVGPRDSLQIYFTAKLADGRVIDGTSPGLPAPIDLSGTLAGLGEGLQQMREGDHCELVLPPALAFGAKGTANGTVPPNQALLFDVTVVSARPAAMGGVAQGSSVGFTSMNGESHAYFTIHP